MREYPRAQINLNLYLVRPFYPLKPALKTTTSPRISELEKSVVKAILYYDVFNHPLTESEAFESSTHNKSRKEISAILARLCHGGHLYSYNGHFSVKENIEELVKRRKTAESKAKKALDKAHSRSKLIGKFPYVKAAYISGSMAKGVMYEDGDVDFFIITEPGRLWLARTLLIFYKKVFLFNSHEFFCVNYFIDSDNLEIEEKNIFSATETVTLKPIYDSGFYQDFLKANSWSREYFPNYPEQKVVYNGKTPRPVAKVIERIFNNSLGDGLDKFFMQLTLKFWQKKFNYFEKADFEIALKTRSYVSKHHPQNFQRKVTEALNSRISEFEEKFGASQS